MSFVLKIAIDGGAVGSVRRVRIADASSFGITHLSAHAARVAREASPSLGVGHMTYVDDEGDVITVGTDEGVQEAIRLSLAEGRKCLRVTVHTVTTAAPTAVLRAPVSAAAEVEVVVATPTIPTSPSPSPSPSPTPVVVEDAPDTTSATAEVGEAQSDTAATPAANPPAAVDVVAEATSDLAADVTTDASRVAAAATSSVTDAFSALRSSAASVLPAWSSFAPARPFVTASRNFDAKFLTNFDAVVLGVPGTTVAVPFVVANAGRQMWPLATRLLKIGGVTPAECSAEGGFTAIPSGLGMPEGVAPQETVQSELRLDIPADHPAGVVTSIWRLVHPNGVRFGQRLSVAVEVVRDDVIPSTTADAPSDAAAAPTEPEPEPVVLPIEPTPAEAAAEDSKTGDDASITSSTEEGSSLCARIVAAADECFCVRVAPGTVVSKTFTLRNEGEQQWPSGCRLVHVGGAQLAGPTEGVPVPAAAAEETATIALRLVAPTAPGNYTSEWRLVTSQGKRFGHRVWLDVAVMDSVPSLPFVMF